MLVISVEIFLVPRGWIGTSGLGLGLGAFGVSESMARFVPQILLIPLP